jgi:hypothetical protein
LLGAYVPTGDATMFIEHVNGVILDAFHQQTKALLALAQPVGLPLGLLQQVLRPQLGFDGVEHDADALQQLVQQRQVHRAETLD